MPDASLNSWLQKIKAKYGYRRRAEKFFGLDNISQDLLESKIANKVIIIGGTNGKGSTAEFLLNLLLSQKKNVGLYTSPHLYKFSERIRVNGHPVDDDLIIKSFKATEKKLEGESGISFFDFITMSAFHYFSSIHLDYVILEVGLGGRLDPVNIMEPDISILTNVDLDHTNVLGISYEEIAIEKSAIYRKHKISILGQEKISDKVKSILQERSEEGLFYKAGEDFGCKLNIRAEKWDYFYKKNQKEKQLLDIPLGNLAPESAACAITAYVCLGYDLHYGLKEIMDKTFLAGRRELKGNKILLDVCHNPASAEYLVNFIKRKFTNQEKIHAVFGVMSDKDVKGIVKPLIPIVSNWYVTEPVSDISMKSSNLKNLLSKLGVKRVTSIPKVTEACKEAIFGNHIDDIILVFGSFLTISEARKVVDSWIHS